MIASVFIRIVLLIDEEVTQTLEGSDRRSEILRPIELSIDCSLTFLDGMYNSHFVPT